MMVILRFLIRGKLFFRGPFSVIFSLSESISFTTHTQWETGFQIPGRVFGHLVGRNERMTSEKERKVEFKWVFFIAIGWIGI